MKVKAGSVEQMVSRSAAFFGDRIKRSSCREARHIQALDQITSEDDDKRYLSIAEMGAPKQNADVGQDFLVVVLPAPDDAGAKSGTIIAITPDALRSSSRETRNSIYINDIALGPEEKALEKVSILAYAVSRNAMTARLLENLKAIVEMLAESTDQVRALSLSQAVLDCVEALESSGDAEIVIAGNVFARAENDAREGTHFLALVSAQTATAAEAGRWWVRGSNLQWGENADTASSATGSYLLLRYGARPTQRSVRRHIEELRRKYALKRDELQAGGAGESYESYVEKEVEKRKQSGIDALYSHHKMRPMVTPLALEVDKELETVVALGADPDTPFQRLLNAMRDEFITTYGITIPGLRVRVNDTDMPADTYLIMINETPLVMGTASRQKRLCSAPVGLLKEIDVEAEAATNPDDYSECSWISENDVEIAQSKGFKTWDPAEYIILHLKNVLRNNMSDFLGTQEIADAIRGEDEGELLKRLQSDHGGLSRFKNVICALLEEKLPARPLPLLTKRYLEMVGMPAYEVAEELRCLETVNTQLLKDLANWRVFALANDYLELIGRSLIFQGDAALLAIEPELTQEALSAVRKVVNDQLPASTRPVILIEDWRLRPFIRKLVELEFPLLKVVAQREVAQVEPGLLQTFATISLGD